MGLSPWQRLFAVELPLAAPVDPRRDPVSVTITIGTATISSTSAPEPGHADFERSRRRRAPVVIEVSVLVSCLRSSFDLLFARLDRRLRRRRAL